MRAPYCRAFRAAVYAIVEAAAAVTSGLNLHHRRIFTYAAFYIVERIRGQGPVDNTTETFSCLEAKAMSSSIIRFAKSTNAVESGFLAAGVTIWVVAVVQSFALLLGWAAY